MRNLIVVGAMLLLSLSLAAQRNLQLLDIYNLGWISQPTISKDGDRTVYVRNGYDIVSDRQTSDLWFVNSEGEHLPLIVGPESISYPRFSPDGNRICYVSNAEEGSELFVYYFDTGTSLRVSRQEGSISRPVWSPDGQRIAFNAPVKFKAGETVVKLPPKPDGAKWSKTPMYVDRLQFRADGAGFRQNTRQQVFIVPATGRFSRQITAEAFDVLLDDWSDAFRTGPNGTGKTANDLGALLVTANPNNANESDPSNTDIARVHPLTGELDFIIATAGPDRYAKLSPDGKKIAYLSNPDTRRGYENAMLFVADQDGQNARNLSSKLDRSISRFQWVGDRIAIQYDIFGDTRIAYVDLDGSITDMVQRVGGLSLGRPYAGGSFSASQNGKIAYTQAGSTHPAELGFFSNDKAEQQTSLNEELLLNTAISGVEEINVKSTADGERVQAWVIKPPNYDRSKSYPLILEIHGGPYTNYGDRFSFEAQAYAAAGYVVVYANPRGSTSYGERFANLIEDNYPGEDYDDLMTVVDEVIKTEAIDEDRLYVTGGSGGGVLTAWIVGKTNRFKAAVVAKPVINWTSFVLYADATPFFSRYWFANMPWEDQASYWGRSPLSLVGNVETPTMLLTGEKDYRTPMGESEQYYTALKLRGVPTAMVRIAGAGHSIASRPSNLMAKISGVLGWFERYGGEPVAPLLGN